MPLNTSVRLPRPPTDAKAGPTWNRQAFRTIEDAFNGQAQPSLPTVIPYATPTTIRPFVTGPIAIITMAGVLTVNLDGTNLLPGSTLRLVLIQDGTGGRVITWGTGISWGAIGAPAPTTTLNTTAIYDFYWSGTSFSGHYYGSAFT